MQAEGSGYIWLQLALTSNSREIKATLQNNAALRLSAGNPLTAAAPQQVTMPHPGIGREESRRRARGKLLAMIDSFKTALHNVITLTLNTVASGRRFRLNGHEYCYFNHKYNHTWNNERCVEVPVAVQFLRGVGGPVLEVGNVLSHYVDLPHDVIDKFEVAAGVINCDILDYAPSQPYAAIVTISTIEHIGWGETCDPYAWKESGQESQPDKALEAVEHLKTLLQPGGRLLVTVPTGFNPSVDRSLAVNAFGFDDIACLRRVGVSNWQRWEETSVAEALKIPFGRYHADAVAFGTYQRPSRETIS